MSVREQGLGAPALFLLPSLKLKERAAEERVHRFLMENFGGYTAAAGNIFGFWRGPDGRDSYGEHRQFMVAVDDPGKRDALVKFLSKLAADLGEQSILLQAGGAVSLVWAQR